MQNQTLSELTGIPAPLSDIILKSRNLSEYYSFFSNAEELKYYSQFPQIQASVGRIENKISDLIKSIGGFVGFEGQGKNNIKLDSIVDIIDLYADNIEIKIKKYQEEEQKIRIKQRNPEKGKEEAKQQWKLKHPERSNILSAFDFDKINHENMITPSTNINSQPLKYIDTQDKFTELLLKLTQQKEIAVDLQHSDKSYYGFTCLIQISTRTEDFIIDVLPLWNVIPQLNTIFNNPNILKVLHGAYMDVKWLHRDFDIKLSNLFDTFHAAQHLSHQQCSYAYLLKHYCEIKTDKKYQMADWRERPLSQEMLLYARTDTHYLLQIYDKMKGDIIKQAYDNKMDSKEALNSVFAKSRDVSQTNFVQINFKKTRWYEQMIQKQRSSYPQKRCKLLQKLFQIRDQIAKQQDENCDKFIPAKYLYQLADKKQFIPTQITKIFRKNPELKNFIPRISNQMTQFIKDIDAQVQEKGLIVPQMTFQQYNKETRVHHAMQQQPSQKYQDLYFQLDSNTKCTLKQFSKHSLQFKQSKSLLLFQCPLSYQIGFHTKK